MTRIGFSEAARDDRRAITAHTVEQFGEHAVRFGVGFQALRLRVRLGGIHCLKRDESLLLERVLLALGVLARALLLLHRFKIGRREREVLDLRGV